MTDLEYCWDSVTDLDYWLGQCDRFRLLFGTVWQYWPAPLISPPDHSSSLHPKEILGLEYIYAVLKLLQIKSM